ncbi:hypothetical protein N7449_008019 [Penicillium cf. viridicatum]|uniref:Uncharacterized protein n=1 Tax=Penicillium cf. viridicatum TaxID=2972119 RepID=A0A9W9JIE3_9EURO|nr:hypothetical protein N7449_008019 [Penicillium cf. viridicatum]
MGDRKATFGNRRTSSRSDMPQGFWLSYAVGKFECHREDDHKRDFMRICLQAPNLDTEFRTPMRKLLALRQDKQDDTGIVPGIYRSPIVGEGAGENMDINKFWVLPDESRADVRLKFKALYSEILAIGMEFLSPTQLISSMSLKPVPYIILIILRRLAGFRQATQTKDPQKWDDMFYVMFGLVDIPDTQNWSVDHTTWIWKSRIMFLCHLITPV